jgi:hypothetical protein
LRCSVIFFRALEVNGCLRTAKPESGVINF